MNRVLEQETLVYRPNDEILLPNEKRELINSRELLVQRAMWKRNVTDDNDLSDVSILDKHGFQNIYKFQGSHNEEVIVKAIERLLKEKFEACVLPTEEDIHLLQCSEELKSTVKRLSKVFDKFGLRSFREASGNLIFLCDGQSKSIMIKGAEYLYKNWKACQKYVLNLALGFQESGIRKTMILRKMK